MFEILFLLGMWIYWLSEGCTEGYTFASSKRRKENKLICGRIGEGVAKVDYHAWRLGENVGMIMAIAGAYLLSTEMFTLKFAMLLAGSWLTGTWIYERALNHVFSNDLFPKKSPYHLLGLTFPRNQIVEGILTAGIGLVLTIGSLL
jgi:hypothetical protein